MKILYNIDLVYNVWNSSIHSINIIKAQYI